MSDANTSGRNRIHSITEPDGYTLVPGAGNFTRVVKPVSVEIPRVGQEVVRIALRIKFVDRSDFMANLELRPLVPIRAGYNVRIAVAVEVTVVGAFA